MIGFKLLVSAIAAAMTTAAFFQPGMGAGGLGFNQAVQIDKGPIHALISAALLALGLLMLWTHTFTDHR